MRTARKSAADVIIRTLTHPAPRQQAPEDLRRPMMLRASRGQRHRRGSGRTTVDGRTASGTIEVVSAFDLSARTMTTRLTRIGSARPCALDQPAGMSGGSGFAIESTSRTDRQKVEPFRRWFHRRTARGGVRPRTPICPIALASPSIRCSQGAVFRAPSRLKPWHRINGKDYFLRL